MRMFQTPRTLMLFAFREGVGFVPVPGVGEGVSSLTLMLSDAGVSGRAASLLLLAHDNSPEVLPALREALKDKDGSVRAAAVHSIALHDNPDFMADLLPLMDDPKDAVRFRAAAGYIRLAGIKATPKRPAAATKSK
jgi:HEAT repeat protein